MTYDQISPSLTRSWIEAARKAGYFVRDPDPIPASNLDPVRVKKMHVSQQGVKRHTTRCDTEACTHFACYKYNEGNGVYSLFCSGCRARIIEGTDDNSRARWHSI